LRGAFLRTTEWIIGVVVYTGPDTKIMMNAEKSKVKMSEIEHRMNTYILAILAF
jgi:magnesium-transporting ATPase (P-type)